MKSFFTPLAIVAFVASTVSAQTYVINTPNNVVVCLPTLLTWSGGVPPYFLTILPAGQPTAPALIDLGKQEGNAVTWLANLGAGTSAFLNLLDSTGTVAQSGPFTPLSGSNITCVSEPVSQSQAAPTGTPASTPNTSAATTPAGTSTTQPSTTTGKAADAKSAAISKYASAGAVAMFGSALFAIAL